MQREGVIAGFYVKSKSYILDNIVINLKKIVVAIKAILDKIR